MKKALIVGGTSGIGRCLSEKLLDKGWQVAVTGRRKELLNELNHKYKSNVSTYVHDVKNIEQSDTILTDIFNKMQTLDLVIVASGSAEINYELKWELEEDTIQTNINGVAKIYQQVFSFFKTQSYGHLVGISSIAAIRGNRHSPSYSAAKAFQANYLEALRCMSKKEQLNIVITDVQPGFVNTAMAKGDGLFWVASVEKASNQILKAIHKQKRKVYVTKRWKSIAYIMKFLPTPILEKI